MRSSLFVFCKARTLFNGRPLKLPLAFCRPLKNNHFEEDRFTYLFKILCLFLFQKPPPLKVNVLKTLTYIIRPLKTLYPPLKTLYPPLKTHYPPIKNTLSAIKNTLSAIKNTLSAIKNTLSAIKNS